jgi:hypothetical protein
MIVHGQIITKTYFDHFETIYQDSSFYSGFFDYLFVKKDTVFIVGGFNNISDSNFLRKAQILCILRNQSGYYSLKEQVNFLSSMSFLKNYYDKTYNDTLYAYSLNVAGLPAHMAFITRIDFFRDGRIGYYELYDGFSNCKSQCRKALTSDKRTRKKRK